MRRGKQPPALYPPRRKSLEALAREAGEAAHIALGSAQIAKRAADSMPKPDRRLDPNFQRLSGQEQSFLARISPRRIRWPELREIDLRLVELDTRQEGLSAGLVDLRGRRERAEAEHAERLAAWLEGGQAEPRPTSEVRELEDAITESGAEYAAIDSLRERVLAERIEFVDKHRKRLMADAERETAEAKARYLQLVDQAEQARAALVELRETTIWASLYPSEVLASFAPSHALVGGRPRETARHLASVEQSIRHSARRRCSRHPDGGPLNLNNFRRRMWGPAVRASGIATPARIYDLRSTFASNALAAGVTVFELAKVMGTSVAMIERHYGTLIGGAHAGIVGRLDALEAELEREGSSG